jgi:hypothetical protein
VEVNKDHPNDNKKSDNSKLARARQPAALLTFSKDSKAGKKAEKCYSRKKQRASGGLLLWGS